MSYDNTPDYNAVFDAIYKNHGSLDPDILVKIARITKADSYHIINIVCRYINETKIIENKEDLKHLCYLQNEIKRLENKLNQVNIDFGELSVKLSKSNNAYLEKCNELDSLKLKYQDLERKYDEKCDLEEMKNLIKAL